MTLPIDPLLYIAFAIGLVAHRVAPAPARWLDRGTLAVVYLLVGLLGAELGGNATPALWDALPVGIAAAALLAVLSSGIARYLSRGRGPWSPRMGADHPRPWFGLSFVAAFVVGLSVGFVGGLEVAWAVPFALYALLGLVGWGLRWSTDRLSEIWIPLAACIVAALIVAVFLVATIRESAPEALATTFAFGFYSLAGPLLAAHAGATIGFVAFLANFLRENLTMVSSPYVGPRWGPESLIAMGGATSMDTTLYFVTSFGDAEAGGLALSTGLCLTVVATLALPLLVALAG